MWIRPNTAHSPEDGGEGGSAGGAAAPAAAPAPAPAAAPAAPAPSPAPAAPAPSPAAPAPAPASGTPAPAPAPAGDKKVEETPGYWPENWRETVSKEDVKMLDRLKRYASPAAMAQALIAAQNKISSGELKPSLGKNATPDELKEYRAANGIPEDPKDYDLKGLKTDSMDPELLGVLLKNAHDTNQTADHVKATLKTWDAIQQKVAASRAEADIKSQQDGEEELRAEWGGQFRHHINLINGMLDGTADAKLKENVYGARLADGTLLANSPGAMRWLAQLALIQNPAGVVVPGAGADPLKGVEGEMAQIEKTMRTNRKAYDADEKMQARYRELIVAKEKLVPRKRA